MELQIKELIQEHELGKLKAKKKLKTFNPNYYYDADIDPEGYEEKFINLRAEVKWRNNFIKQLQTLLKNT